MKQRNPDYPGRILSEVHGGVAQKNGKCIRHEEYCFDKEKMYFVYSYRNYFLPSLRTFLTNLASISPLVLAEVGVPRSHLFFLSVYFARAMPTRGHQHIQPHLHQHQRHSSPHHQRPQLQQQVRGRRSALPHATPGNVIEPLLAACRAGAQRDVNAKCRDT